MGIVTLTTDWGTRDYYIAALKGGILSRCPGATLVDVSHDFANGRNIVATAYLLRGAWSHFPKGTVHLICTNSNSITDGARVLVSHGGHFFIAPNSGLLSLALDNIESLTAIEIDKPAGMTGVFSVLPEVVAQVLENRPLQSYKKVELRTLVHRRPTIEFAHTLPGEPERVARMVGHVQRIEERGNVITNISRAEFVQRCAGRRYEIYLNTYQYKISTISRSYDEVGGGDLLAFFNSMQLLEVAVAQGNAAHLYKLDYKSSFTVKFLDQ